MTSNDLSRSLFGTAAVAALVAAAPASAAELHRVQADHVLGTSFEMAVAGVSQAQAEFAFAAARVEIDRLDSLLSGWRTDSELSRLNAAQSHAASPELFEVLSRCQAWTARTDGAFNAQLGEVEKAWRAATTTPDAQALCSKAEAARTAAVLDAASHRIERPAGVTFAPDGLAKGFIIDAALDAARRATPCARGMLLNIGGDLACYGEDQAGRPWRAGIGNPADLSDNAAPIMTVALRNEALAVSGPGPRDRSVGGEMISHIIDPHTGQPAARSQVAVVAKRAADADAAATALAALPASQALALAERLTGVEALILANGEALQTSGWVTYATSAIQCQAPLPAGFVAEVNYELPVINVGNYKRPFVIIWVTDADKNVVKHLLVTGRRAEWQQGNIVWWRRYGRKAPELLNQATPTKGAGKYSVVWDGTDETGARAAQGAYTINIEAAREHGGHSYQAVEVTLGAAGVEGAATGGDELGAAKVRYFKR